MIEEGKTVDPYLMAVFRARRMNQWMGTAIVGPWDLVEDPDKYDEWIDVIDALSEAPKLARKKQIRDQAQRAFFERQDREHPTYRKYRQ